MIARLLTWWRALVDYRPYICPTCHDQGDYGGCGTCGIPWGAD